MPPWPCAAVRPFIADSSAPRPNKREPGPPGATTPVATPLELVVAEWDGDGRLMGDAPLLISPPAVLLPGNAVRPPGDLDTGMRPMGRATVTQVPRASVRRSSRWATAASVSVRRTGTVSIIMMTSPGCRPGRAYDAVTGSSVAGFRPRASTIGSSSSSKTRTDVSGSSSLRAWSRSSV